MDYLISEINDGIAVLTVNRPKALNALNRELLEDIRSYLQTALENNIKVLILTGAGDKAFIAGADIKAMNEMNKDEIVQFSQLGQNIANVLETAPFVTIAAVNGFALGGGLEMALACDFIYASENALMGLPETDLGLIPGFGGSIRLSKAIGKRLAKELVMTGKKITAQEAKRINLVNEVLPKDALMKHAQDVAHQIAQKSLAAITSAKVLINCSQELFLTDALDLERNLFQTCFDTVERRNAMTKFIEKR